MVLYRIPERTCKYRQRRVDKGGANADEQLRRHINLYAEVLRNDASRTPRERDNRRKPLPSSPEPIHLDAVIQRQPISPQSGEDTMKMILLTTVVLVAFASPAFADFFVVQDTNNKQCSIVEQRPTDASKGLGGGTSAIYKDRAGAENAMRNSVLCRST